MKIDNKLEYVTRKIKNCPSRGVVVGRCNKEFKKLWKEKNKLKNFKKSIDKYKII